MTIENFEGRNIVPDWLTGQERAEPNSVEAVENAQVNNILIETHGALNVLKSEFGSLTDILAQFSELNTREQLLKMLENPDLTEDQLILIANNRLANNSIYTSIVNHPNVSLRVFDVLLSKSNLNEQNISFILAHKFCSDQYLTKVLRSFGRIEISMAISRMQNLSVSVIQSFLSLDIINNEIIRNLLLQANINAQNLEILARNPKTSTDSIDLIVDHRLCSSPVLKAVLQNINLTNGNLFKILLKSQLDQEILSLIFKINIISREVLAALLEHSGFTTFLVKEFIEFAIENSSLKSLINADIVNILLKKSINQELVDELLNFKDKFDSNTIKILFDRNLLSLKVNQYLINSDFELSEKNVSEIIESNFVDFEILNSLMFKYVLSPENLLHVSLQIYFNRDLAVLILELYPQLSFSVLQNIVKLESLTSLDLESVFANSSHLSREDTRSIHSVISAHTNVSDSLRDQIFRLNT